MDTGIGRGLIQIVMAILAIALIALLVNRASDTASLMQTSGNVFNDILKTVTLQSSMGTFGGFS